VLVEKESVTLWSKINVDFVHQLHLLAILKWVYGITPSLVLATRLSRSFTPMFSRPFGIKNYESRFCIFCIPVPDSDMQYVQMGRQPTDAYSIGRFYPFTGYEGP
jgi:hypothetical protein